MTNAKILIYQTSDEPIQFNVQLENKIVCLIQRHMSKLFVKANSTINEHIINTFSKCAIDEKVFIRKLRKTFRTFLPKE